MNVTISAISSQYIHMSLAPFVLKKAVEENCPGARVTICDVNINETTEAITEQLMKNKPDVVCFCVYIWNREATEHAAARLKVIDSSIVIICGGPEVTYSGETAFEELHCNYLIRGAGENSLPMVINRISSGEPMGSIKGVCTKENGKIILSEISPAPAPRTDIYDDCWKSMLQGRMAYVETTRGCPFSCGFCLSGNKENVVCIPKEQALELLIEIGNSGTDTVKIIDRTFNYDNKRTIYLVSGLIKAKEEGKIGDVCYHMEVGGDIFDAAALDVIAEAPPGLFQMEAGLQSFNETTLEKCSRHTDMQRLESNLRRIISNQNVHVHIDLIAGLPDENYQSFAESFNKAYKLHPHQLQLGFLKLLHGSRLRSTYWGQKFDPNPPYEVLSTPWISYYELEKLHHCADGVDKIHNSQRFGNAEQLIFNSTSATPFDFFMAAGEKIHNKKGNISTENLTEMLLEMCIDAGIDENATKDALLLDLLETNYSGHIPDCLRQEQEHYKAAKKAAGEYHKQHPDEGNVRFAALSTGDTAAAVWKDRNRVTGKGKVILLKDTCDK